jgi:hypothetical protein
LQRSRNSACRERLGRRIDRDHSDARSAPYRGHLRISHRDKGVKVYELAHPLLKPLAAAHRVTQFAGAGLEPLRAASGAQLRELSAIVVSNVIARHKRHEGGRRDDRRRSRPARKSSMESRTCGPPARRSRSNQTTMSRLLDSVRSDRLGSPPLRAFLEVGPPVRGLYAARKAAPSAYYALPLLWRDAVIGWRTPRWSAVRSRFETGFSATRPREATFRRRARRRD